MIERYGGTKLEGWAYVVSGMLVPTGLDIAGSISEVYTAASLGL